MGEERLTGKRIDAFDGYRLGVEMAAGVSEREATCPNCGLGHPWACVECGTTLDAVRQNRPDNEMCCRLVGLELCDDCPARQLEPCGALGICEQPAGHDGPHSASVKTILAGQPDPSPSVDDAGAVLRAARLLRYTGWDSAEGYPHDPLDLSVEPSPNLINAVRSAFRAATSGIPENEYVMRGPAPEGGGG